MMQPGQLFFASMLLLHVSMVQAKLNVFACEPEWAVLMTELAGEQAEVFSATHAKQDPHHIEARPSLIAKMRQADLLVCTGAGLESGWLPLLLRQAANSKVLPGTPGMFEAAMIVDRLDVPASIDRRHGDVHAEGNPHVHLDPHRLLQIADALSTRLVALDSANRQVYENRHRQFVQRMQAAIQRWRVLAQPLKGARVAAYHKDALYLFDWLGIELGVTLEPKPGIPPSAGYLAEVKEIAVQQPVKMVVYAAYQNDQAARWLGRVANIPVVELPYTVGGSERAVDLFSLFDDTIEKMLGALQ